MTTGSCTVAPDQPELFPDKPKHVDKVSLMGT